MREIKEIPITLEEKLSNRPELIEKIKGTMFKLHSGVVLKIILDDIEKIAESNLDQLGRILDLVVTYKGEQAGAMIIGLLGDIAEEQPKQLESVVKVLEKYAGQEAGWAVAISSKHIAKNSPKQLTGALRTFETIAGAISGLDEKLGFALCKVIGDTAEYNPDYLSDVLTELSLIEMPDNYTKAQKKILNIDDAFFKFKESYIITGESTAIKANEDANEILYEEGVGIIKLILNGKISLSPDLEFFYASEMRDIKTKTKKAEEDIKKTKGIDVIAKEEKRRLKEIKSRLRTELVSKKLTELKQKENWSLADLKETLSQLTQHWLRKDSKAAKQAKTIAESIFVAERELTSNTLEVWVWQKSIKDLPTYKEYMCCTFESPMSGLISYILNPAVQLIKIRLGDATAIAICAYTILKGKKMLLVDSVESGRHLFARKNVSEAVLLALKDFAKASKFCAVIVSDAGGNTSAKEFYKNIDGKSCKSKLILGSSIVEPYFETKKVKEKRTVGYHVNGKVYTLK